jgi:hypothetical protein
MQPSGGDLLYAEAILKANLDHADVLLPIVSSPVDGGVFEMRAFVASRTGHRLHVRPLELSILERIESAPVSCYSQMAIFEKIRGAYDLERLEHSRLLAVGCGGAASFIEDMARCGVGEFVLVDPDHVSAANIGTQQTYGDDVDRSKVECLTDRIRRINPLAFVVACPMSLDDLSDRELCWLARTPLTGAPPVSTLVAGMTDDFYAQARVNRLALNFGLPSLCAQVYAEGRAAEVTFTHPAVTPACHRCRLDSRYRAYLEEGFINDVGSGGTPYVSTARLNALKQFVALALLQYGSRHARWGELLERIRSRNLVQVRLDPDIPLPGFAGLSETDDRLFCDEAVWLRHDHGREVRPCPDCGGRGDLRTAVGTIADTRVRRSHR